MYPIIPLGNHMSQDTSADNLLGKHPPGTRPSGAYPSRQTASRDRQPPLKGGYGQQAGGTHPTGMHSILFYFQEGRAKFQYAVNHDPDNAMNVDLMDLRRAMEKGKDLMKNGVVTLEQGGFLPAATKLGQGNVFTGVCDSVQEGGGGLVPGGWWSGPGVGGGLVPRGLQFFGGLQFFWGVSIFSGGLQFFRGGVSNFSGGSPNFGGSPNYCQHPPPRIWLMSGQYASYWNALLLSTQLNLTAMQDNNIL